MVQGADDSTCGVNHRPPAVHATAPSHHQTDRLACPPVSSRANPGAVLMYPFVSVFCVDQCSDGPSIE